MEMLLCIMKLGYAVFSLVCREFILALYTFFQAT